MNEININGLRVKVPIIQGGMGVGISLSRLASAVANEGGIGVISAVGIGLYEPDYMKNFHEANIRALRKEIRKAKSMTDGILGVNIMLAASDFEDLLKTAIEEQIDIVFLSAGLPIKICENILPYAFNNIKTKFVPKVSSAKAVRIIFQYWSEHYKYVPDAIAIEGPLAGGHLGFKKRELIDNNISLASIIEEAVEIINPYQDKYNKEIPIIAAGGIYNGRDIYEIMLHGAKAVKMGTRFVTTYECDASIHFKESYINSKKEDIIFIDSPVGLPGRVIRNDFVNEIEAGKKKPFKCYWKCLKTCDVNNIQFCIAETLFNAARGNMTEGFAFAGAKAYLATKLESVKEIFEKLISEYDISATCLEIPCTFPLGQKLASVLGGRS